MRNNFCQFRSKVLILHIMMKASSSLCTTFKTVKIFQLLPFLQMRLSYTIRILTNSSSDNFIIITSYCTWHKMKVSSKCPFVHILNTKECLLFVKHRFLRISVKLHQKDMRSNSISFRTKFMSDLCMDLLILTCTPIANTLF